MKKMYLTRIVPFIAAMTMCACASVPTAFEAGKTYTVTFSTGTTATVTAGEDFVFAITCQPPTDISDIKASAGTLTADKTVLGGPSTPQGVIKGLWTLSEITGDVTITLTLNTQEGAELPKIITGKTEAEAAMSSAGSMGAPGGTPPSGAPGGAPPSGAPGGAPPN